LIGYDSSRWNHFDVTTARASTPGSLEPASSLTAGTIETGQNVNPDPWFICGEKVPPPGFDVRASFIRMVYLETDSLTDTLY
jgi:hypothetical protein